MVNSFSSAISIPFSRIFIISQIIRAPKRGVKLTLALKEKGRVMGLPDAATLTERKVRATNQIFDEITSKIDEINSQRSCEKIYNKGYNTPPI